MASNFSVELFKVPFDNSYKKVFDIDRKALVYSNNCEKIFHDKVLSNYDNKSIAQPSVSNIKRYNNRIIFTIRENYFDCRNYNYVSLNYKDKYYFYFITDIVSENDNPVNPAITITAEWDIWHNHLTDLYLHKVDNIENVVQSHKVRNVKNTVTGKIDRYFYKQNFPKLSTVKIPHNDGGVKVLFIKMVVDENFYKLLDTEYLIGNSVFSTGDTGNQISSTTVTLKNVIYIPVGVRTSLLNNEIRTDITFKTATNGYIKYVDSKVVNMPQISAICPFDIYKTQIQEKYTPYIISAEFTYNSPIKYEWINGDIVFECVGGKCATIFNNQVGLSVGIPKMLIFTIPKEFNYDNSVRKTQDWYINRQIYDIELNNRDLLPQQNSVTENVDDNDNINDEIALYNYPFKYYSLYYNNSEIPIENIYKYGAENITYISKDNKSNQTNFKVKNDSQTGQFNNGNIFLKSNGYLTLSKDALQDYLIRNGSQEQTALSMKMLSNLPNFLSKQSIFKGITNTFSDIFSVLSKHADLRTTPDTVSLSDRGEDDLFIQDDLIVYLNSIKDINILKDYYKYFYIYGYEYAENVDILENTRFWFDYKKTVNCKLNNCINANDKQRIEQMFDDGVHMFHINYDVNSEIFIINRSMEFNGKNNIERSIATI